MRLALFERGHGHLAFGVVSGAFDYEGAEFSWYGAFEVDDNGDYNLVDAGAD